MEARNCKFSQQSLEQLHLLDKDGICPGCKRPKAEHSLVVGLGKIPFTRKNFIPRMKRVLQKASVQAIIIGTIVAFVVFALGIVVNYFLKNGDNEECNMKNYAKMDGGKVNRVIGYSEKCGFIKIIYLTVTSTTMAPHDDISNSNTIMKLLLTGSLFVFFYLMLIFCLARRQTRLRQQALLNYDIELKTGVDNTPTNVQQFEIVSTELCKIPEGNV